MEDLESATLDGLVRSEWGCFRKDYDTQSPWTYCHQFDHIGDMDHSSREERIKKAFGKRVRFLRQEREMSQETLALACDLDRTYIGGVERGERNISLLNIYKIADALGVPPGDLVK